MILVLGGVTGGLGKELHKFLCGMFYEQQTVLAIGRQDCDLESEESITAFLSKVGQGFTAALGNYASPLHIINATGVSVSAMIHKADILDINRMLRVNLVGNILLLKHARELYKEHGGTFTMLSSVTASDGPVGTAVYAASKSALVGLTRVASKEFARWNTRVNCLELGYCNAGLIGQLSPVQRAEVIGRVPLQRLGGAQDLAEACRFVIQCGYVTGAVIKLNGGMA